MYLQLPFKHLLRILKCQFRIVLHNIINSLKHEEKETLCMQYRKLFGCSQFLIDKQNIQNLEHIALKMLVIPLVHFRLLANIATGDFPCQQKNDLLASLELHHSILCDNTLSREVTI